LEREHRGHLPEPASVLTEIYIEALLVDEELADQVWAIWDKGEIDDQVAFISSRLFVLTIGEPHTPVSETKSKTIIRIY
jgi:hypothetical protein